VRAVVDKDTCAASGGSVRSCLGDEFVGLPVIGSIRRDFRYSTKAPVLQRLVGSVPHRCPNELLRDAVAGDSCRHDTDGGLAGLAGGYHRCQCHSRMIVMR
jgi:hypothetical protein